MQHNLIIGNVARVTPIANTNKAYIVVADNEPRKDKSDPTGTKYIQHANFITLQAFIPEKLKIEKGMLIAATYITRTYMTKDGKQQNGNDVLTLNVRLNNPRRANSGETAAPAQANAGVPTPEEQQMQMDELAAVMGAGMPDLTGMEDAMMGIPQAPIE